MHDSVTAFAQQVVAREHVAGKKVLEVGARDVSGDGNGSIRPTIEALHPAQYVGVDARPGPAVDYVVDGEHLCETVGRSSWGLVVCVETLEHIHDWRAAVAELADSVAVGGHLLLTTLTPVLPDDPDVVLAHDHWVFDVDSIRKILALAGFDAHVESDTEVDGVLSYARKSGERKPLDAVEVEKRKGLQERCC